MLCSGYAGAWVRRAVCGCALLTSFLLAARSAPGQSWPEIPDQRTGVVATDTSGWPGPVMPMQGPAFFDALGIRWWYNYLPDSAPQRVFPGYHKLYMYWRATATSYTAAQIQAHAAAAAAAYPGETIWWAMSNEPNDRGQANQSATDFAAIYYLHHKNLKLGDPNCKVIGPGILNWDFLSTSVWQRGKDWYEEFRQAWYSNPECRQYSETNYGVSYPPQDGFNFHAYDLRGVQGTPWEPEDWRYSRDQLLMVYSDIGAHPEVLNKQIWLTEFGALRSATMADNIILTRQLVGWMRDQPFMQRWIWFSIHSDKYWADTTPPRLELLDDNGQPTAVGLVARELANLPLEVRVDPVNGHYAGDPVVPYLRVGASTANGISDVAGDHLRFELVQDASLSVGTMRGRTISAASDHLIRKVTFRFQANYDSARVVLVVDGINTTGRQKEKWLNDQYGSSSGDVVLLFGATERIRSLGIAMNVRQSFTYTHPTGEWLGEVKDLVIYSEPDRGLVRPDFDLDGDVDLEDFGRFQACLTGQGAPQDDPDCAGAKLDLDVDVDNDDLELFQGCMSGPNVPAQPDCAD